MIEDTGCQMRSAQNALLVAQSFISFAGDTTAVSVASSFAPRAPTRGLTENGLVKLVSMKIDGK